MLKRIFLILSLFFPATIFADGQINVAVVDVQTILDNSTAVNGIKLAVEKIAKDLQNELISKEQELKDEENKILAQKATLAESEFELLVDNFNKKVTDIQKSLQEKKNKLEQVHAKALATVNENALKIISDLATEKTYYIVLPSTQVLYANEKLNITDTVLSRLNNKLPSINLKF